MIFTSKTGTRTTLYRHTTRGTRLLYQKLL